MEVALEKLYELWSAGIISEEEYHLRKEALHREFNVAESSTTVTPSTTATTSTSTTQPEYSEVDALREVEADARMRTASCLPLPFSAALLHHCCGNASSTQSAASTQCDPLPVGPISAEDAESRVLRAVQICAGDFAALSLKTKVPCMCPTARVAMNLTDTAFSLTSLQYILEEMGKETARKKEEEERERAKREIEEERRVVEEEASRAIQELTTQKESLNAKIAELEEAVEDFEANEYPKLKEQYRTDNFLAPGLHVTFLPEFSAVESSRIEMKVLVEAKVGQQSKTATVKRAPFELAIALDVSGSMEGDPLENSKNSILKIIKLLQEGDILHVVTYADYAKVIFQEGKVHTESDRQQLSEKVSRICTEGSTNISAGLQAAYGLFSKNSKNKRVFLFSDGGANEGITDVASMNKLVGEAYNTRGISTTSFGIGPHYNLEMMKGISDSGHGLYFFIDSIESIGKLIDKGMRGLTSLFGIDAELHIRPRSPPCHSMKLGVGSKETLTPPSGSTTTTAANTIDIPVGDLRHEDLKQLLFDAEFDFSGNYPGSSLWVLDWDMAYTEVVNGEFGGRATQRGSLSMSIDATRSEHNKQVRSLSVIRACALQEAQIYELVRTNNFTEAAHLKEEILAQLTSVEEDDPYGFVKILVNKGRKVLCDYQRLAVDKLIASHNETMQRRIRELNTRLRALDVQTVAEPVMLREERRSTKCGELLAKEAHRKMEEEADCDMGFGLFD
ncbi:Protein lifeguard 2 [Pelomyxa schiedti]|nr:Protein lifeguard 2 [Pelomyxa schiedti]